MRSLVLLTALAAAAAWGVVHHLPEGEAEAEPSHPARAQEVQSVALDGQNLPIAALREVLVTHAGDQLDASKLDHDRTALEQAMAARGYLAAKVAAPQVTFDAAGWAFVTFTIASGPVFHVRSVKITGAAERDAGVVTIAAGEVVMADRIAHARDALADRLIARGKQAAVSVKLAPDEASSLVDVELAAR